MIICVVNLYGNLVGLWCFGCVWVFGIKFVLGYSVVFIFYGDNCWIVVVVCVVLIRFILILIGCGYLLWCYNWVFIKDKICVFWCNCCILCCWCDIVGDVVNGYCCSIVDCGCVIVNVIVDCDNVVFVLF